MKFCIITHVQHIKKEDQYFAYAPYVQEMNIWLKYIDQVIIVAPIQKTTISPIEISYQHNDLIFKEVASFEITSLKQLFFSIIRLPKIIRAIYKAMKMADHIHLRCPGNMGLLGAIVQILFPKKKKTAKYAGNWDPKSKQPWTYKLQKWILSNSFLTKNMQVLVYGEWENQTKNIKPFFTATYEESNKKEVIIRDLKNKIHFLFVGTLSIGKQPLYALQIINELKRKGYKVCLDFYGEGIQRTNLELYIKDNDLSEIVFLRGNQAKTVVEKAYQQSHFLLLPSKSEGWPKVVAEAMFWKCLPIATKVSCVPYMLDYGNRGLLLDGNVEKDVEQIISVLENELKYQELTEKAISWSREFTLDKFEAEIKKLLL